MIVQLQNARGQPLRRIHESICDEAAEWHRGVDVHTSSDFLTAISHFMTGIFFASDLPGDCY